MEPTRTSLAGQCISFCRLLELGAHLDLNSLNGPQRKVLRDAVVEAFDRDGLNSLLVDTGFEPLENLTGNKGFETQAFEIIKTFHSEGKLQAFVQAMLEEEGDRPSLRMAMKRASGFGLERQIRSSGFSNTYLWADTLTCLTRKVCHIRIVDGVDVHNGTGFLVGPDLVLTNYHVLEDVIGGGIPPEKVQLTFDYAELAEGRADAIGCLLSDDWLLHHSPYSPADLAPDAGVPQNGELDYALVRISKAVGEIDAPDGTDRGWVDLATAPALPAHGDIVFILHHPSGHPVKHSIGVTKPVKSPDRLRYDADTDRGSSGGMVLNAQLQAFGLHHAGDPDTKIKAQYNQGIPLDLIGKSIAAKVAL
jgi:hypothetical protein